MFMHERLKQDKKREGAYLSALKRSRSARSKQKKERTTRTVASASVRSICRFSFANFVHPPTQATAASAGAVPLRVRGRAVDAPMGFRTAPFALMSFLAPGPGALASLKKKKRASSCIAAREQSPPIRQFRIPFGFLGTAAAAAPSANIFLGI
jgi:hypothetical protein